MGHIVKVADKKQRLFRLLRPADEHSQALFMIGAVDPLETVRIIILLIHGRMTGVESIQCLHVILHLAMYRELKDIPVQIIIFIPFMNLPELLAHKQKLLSGMSHIKAVCSPKISGLYLQGFAGHFS